MSFKTTIAKAVSFTNLKKSNKTKVLQSSESSDNFQLKRKKSLKFPKKDLEKKSLIEKNSKDIEIINLNNKFANLNLIENLNIPESSDTQRTPPGCCYKSYSDLTSDYPDSFATRSTKESEKLSTSHKSTTSKSNSSSSNCIPNSTSSESNIKSASTSKSSPNCHLLLTRVFDTVTELECTLLESRKNDFNLKLAFEQQSAKMDDLRLSLDTEKERNQRLVQLLDGVDSSSSTDDEPSTAMLQPFVRGYQLATGRQAWSADPYESISPLLMQQRYDELSTSYKQCRRQLMKKEKQLKQSMGEKEILLANYDELMSEYRNEQKRCEDLCYKYLRMQAKKNLMIHRLREALVYASECFTSAQRIADLYNTSHGGSHCETEFQQNLQLYIRALRVCEWVQGKYNTTKTT